MFPTSDDVGDGTSVTAVADLVLVHVESDTFVPRSPVIAFPTAPDKRHYLTVCCGAIFAVTTPSRCAATKKICRLHLLVVQRCMGAQCAMWHTRAAPVSREFAGVPLQ